jgi:hypothetical protein
MTGLPMMVLPAQAAARIAGFGSAWGILDLRFDPHENLCLLYHLTLPTT